MKEQKNMIRNSKEGVVRERRKPLPGRPSHRSPLPHCDACQGALRDEDKPSTAQHYAFDAEREWPVAVFESYPLQKAGIKK